MLRLRETNLNSNGNNEPQQKHFTPINMKKQIKEPPFQIKVAQTTITWFFNNIPVQTKETSCMEKKTNGQTITMGWSPRDYFPTYRTPLHPSRH